MSFDLTILVNGKPVTQYFDKNKVKFIEGRPKSPFKLKLENNYNFRILVVISIDGLNLVNMKNEWSSGLIIEPNDSLITDSWLGNFTHIPLTFNKVKLITPNDYNNGVIGCRIYTKENEYKKFDKNVYSESVIYYDDINGLRERGVIIDKKFYYPLAFPS